MKKQEHIAVFCVGNKLMYDDGLGPVVYEQLQSYELPDNVKLFDLGCLTMDRINDVRDFDLIITVDAIDGTDEPVGTLFRFAPEDMAQRSFGTQSLHDLKLSDLFNSAALLGYECDGVCLGMQVENPFPEEVCVGLSPQVEEAVPNLVDLVLAELVNRGIEIIERSSGKPVMPGFHHQMTDKDLLECSPRSAGAVSDKTLDQTEPTDD